jgi:hypothetical protein
VYELNEYPHRRDIGNLWRTNGDINDTWVKRERALGVMEILDLNADLYP